MNSTMIYVCADDFGMSVETCERIRECAESGALNRISVFANSQMQDLEKFIPKNVSLGAHINLVEGKPVTSPDKISLLVDERGYFKHSFFGLLTLSLSPKRREMQKQLYLEMKNQIAHWKNSIAPDKSIQLDSHQHTHMIPLIFKTLMRIIEDEKLDVRYIRIPSEPILPYLSVPLLYKPTNIIKLLVLKVLNVFNKGKLKKSGIKTAVFMGILFSGKMDGDRVSRVLPHYLKTAKNRDIELLFHPGYVNRGERVMDENKKSFNEFYYSEGRKIEFNALKHLKINN